MGIMNDKRFQNGTSRPRQFAYLGNVNVAGIWSKGWWDRSAPKVSK